MSATTRRKASAGSSATRTRNLFGRALHFQLDARASQRSQRFRLLLEQPYAGGQWPGSINYLLYQESERRPTFRVDQRGAQAELARGRNRLR